MSLRSLTCGDTASGLITLPVDKDAPAAWTLTLAVQVRRRRRGMGIDYAFVARARARAVSPTRGLLSALPLFIPTSQPTTKKIRGADLSGSISVSGGTPTPSPGLGGSPIEVEPGPTDLLMDLSTGIPDGDPYDDAADDNVSRTASIDLTITPRVWLAKGS